MKYYVYILYSEKISKYYIGYTTKPQKRLEFHNSEFNKIWSKRGQPWKLLKTFEFDDKTAALKTEKYIKRKKSHQYIEQIIERGTIS